MSTHEQASALFVRSPREGGYTFVTAPDYPGFSVMLEPGEDDAGLNHAFVSFLAAHNASLTAAIPLVVPEHELLPCPFCDAPVQMVHMDVICTECSALTRFAICSVTSPAARLWNKRASLMGVQREDVARVIESHIASVCSDGNSDAAALARQIADAVLALPHTGQPQDEVRVILENHGQQSCYYGKLVSIEPYVAEKREPQRKYDRECKGCGQRHMPPDTQCPICNEPLTALASDTRDAD